MKNVLILICCIYFIIFSFSCSQTADDISLKNIDGHRKYQNEKITIGKETDLLIEYQHLLNENLKSAEALYLLSRVTKNREVEKKLIDKSLAINPQFYYSILSKGLNYEEQQDYIKAEELYKKAISINPKAPQAHNNLGGLYKKMVCDKTNKYSYSIITKVGILNKAKLEISKCTPNWELDKQYYTEVINKLNNEIGELNKKIKIEEKLCSQNEHENYLRIAFRGLGKSIHQINLMAKNDCSFGWYAIVYNQYGGISACQIVTAPNFETGEIETKSCSCND